MEESHSEGGTPLLSSTQLSNPSVLRVKLQELHQEISLSHNEMFRQSENMSEILERFLYGKFLVQSQFLRIRPIKMDKLDKTRLEFDFMPPSYSPVAYIPLDVAGRPVS